MNKKRVYKAYCIDWLDAARDGGWKHLENMEGQSLVEIRAIGWLIKDTKEAITLAQQLSELNHFDNTITIPKSCILKKTLVKGWKVIYD